MCTSMTDIKQDLEGLSHVAQGLPQVTNIGKSSISVKTVKFLGSQGESLSEVKSPLI